MLNYTYHLVFVGKEYSVTQIDGDELPQFVHKELFQLKNTARSRTKFAVLLLRKVFQPSELEGRINIAGAQGKGKSIQLK